MKNRIFFYMRKWLENNPLFWYLGWKTIHLFPVFLPHDKTYLAIRHFGLKSGDILLDVGANDGISALSFFHILPTLRIVSIEPNKIHDEALKRIKEQKTTFDYRITAAGNSTGSMTIFTPVYKKINLHTFTSNNEEQVRDAIATAYGQKIGSKIRIIRSTSEIMPLDQLALDPKVIKIDVEGFEYPVLMGLSNTIERNRPFIILETCHDKENKMQDLLKDLRYVLLDYNTRSDTFSYFSHSTTKEKFERNQIAVPQEKIYTLNIKNNNQQ
ncbi:MAG: FkbM family methyltransferase [Leptolinea sp.]|nr:FkbM family methyltransferase [Leptolinea sp.]